MYKEEIRNQTNAPHLLKSEDTTPLNDILFNIGAEAIWNAKLLKI